MHRNHAGAAGDTQQVGREARIQGIRECCCTQAQGRAVPVLSHSSQHSVVPSGAPRATSAPNPRPFLLGHAQRGFLLLQVGCNPCTRLSSLTQTGGRETRQELHRAFGNQLLGWFRQQQVRADTLLPQLSQVSQVSSPPCNHFSFSPQTQQPLQARS